MNLMNAYSYSPLAVLGKQQQSVKLGNVLKAAKEQLSICNIDEPTLLSEYIIAHTLQCQRLELYACNEKLLSAAEICDIQNRIERLKKGEPLQYILGSTCFFEHNYKTDRRALIPRPETETLVETAVNYDDLWHMPHPCIVDVGTGCGCIVISMVLARPQAEYIATDISKKALSLAKENAQLYNVSEQIKFICCDLLSKVALASADAVISNPPYVSATDRENLPRHIREHEPAIALDGGNDGLKIIKRLIYQAFNTLKPQGFLFMEIGSDQRQDVQYLLKQTGFHDIKISHDLSGKDRVVCAKK
mgnify:CR=1 FL=1